LDKGLIIPRIEIGANYLSNPIIFNNIPNFGYVTVYKAEFSIL